MISIPLFFTFILLFHVVSGQLSTFWSSQDVNRIEQKCLEVVSQQSSSNSKDLYFALKFLKDFQKNPLTSYCKQDQILQTVREANQVGELAYALRTVEACQIHLVTPLSEQQTSLVKDALQVILITLSSFSLTLIFGLLLLLLFVEW